MLADEQEIIAKAQKGDPSAFEVLVQEYQTYAYNLAFRVVGNAQEAEDLAQEAFLRAWLALPQFRGQSKFGTWLYRIVTNLCYNKLPSLHRELASIGEEELLSHPDKRSQTAHERVERKELRQALHRQIDSLPEGYRLLISLYYQEGLPYEEIAIATSLPLGTVKTGLFRAKERLRRGLLAQGEVAE